MVAVKAWARNRAGDSLGLLVVARGLAVDLGSVGQRLGGVVCLGCVWSEVSAC